MNYPQMETSVYVRRHKPDGSMMVVPCVMSLLSPDDFEDAVRLHDEVAHGLSMDIFVPSTPDEIQRYLGGEGLSTVCLEKLGRHITRMSFKFTVEDYTGDFGITFSLDGPYNNRLGASLVAFDLKNSQLACYSDVSSSLRYGPQLASVPFGFMKGREYTVDVIVDGEIMTL